MKLESILGLIFAVVMLGALLSILLLVLRANRKRRMALAKLAAALRMQYLPSDPEGDACRAATFARLYPHGEHPQFSQIIRGSLSGRSVEFFDCTYRQGRQAMTESLVVMAVGANFPHLAIWPEGGPDRPFAASGSAEAAGLEVINFDGAEFDGQFCVAAKDRQFAHAVVTPQMMELLMNGPELFGIELLGGEAVISGGKIEAEELPLYLKMLADFLDRIPGYVWRDYAVGKGGASHAR
jgi:hypothetical protein